VAAQADVLEELAELAVEVRRAMLEPDPEAAEAAAGRAETLVARFELLERERVRLEQAMETGEPPGLAPARHRVEKALSRMLHEGTVSGFTLQRLEDTVEARRAAVASTLGATYMADGRSAGWRAAGVSLSAKG
jgi:hypothetical protein